MSDNEMLKLADKIDYAIRTESQVTFYKVDAGKLSAILRATAASAEPVAWQWRYVGEQEHQWKTPSGGAKITDEELRKEQHKIEQRPLYTHPSADAEIVAALEQVHTISLVNGVVDPVQHRNMLNNIERISRAALAKAKGGSHS